MKINSSAVHWSVISGIGAINIIGSFTPGPFEIRHNIAQGSDSEIRDNVDELRASYLRGGVIALGLGTIAAFFSKSPLPLLASAGASALLVATYESALPPRYRLGAGSLGMLRDPQIIDGEFTVVN